eukprot:CAMPEP_0119319322 /NCGR_PEP_ID=MMETSP1333-20130426/49096_1 /TAXON_ID=418940 /ORGANISM="Scyphosphaera apsteinii, Strain RCC1455" /LENGTH=276 /DNA_ID=CAMNT_0007325701 /DNA_START=33 /DNA_END=863 /DNA_ORIENTATION=+
MAAAGAYLRSVVLILFSLLAQSNTNALAQDGWTERLGLRFKHDCQEEEGIRSWLAWAMSWLAGRKGQRSDSHCESKEQLCSMGELTGLRVRNAAGEVGGSDRDFYDFDLQCGRAWTGWLGMRLDSSMTGHVQTETALCRPGLVVTGVQVLRGRDNHKDRDYLNFRLKCGSEWGSPLGLAFDHLRETRQATCPRGFHADGVRVHRGFQDWGDLDTYEFQLHCSSATVRRESAASSSGSGGTGSSGTFASRAAAAAQAADELRTELGIVRALTPHDEV